MEKTCPDHGDQKVLISSSVEWYLDCLNFVAPNTPPKYISREVSERGCPFDCGACSAHQQKTFLPVVPVTSGCNLDCPICYTVNNNTDAYQMSEEEFAKIIEHLKNQHDDIDIINFTGGEPTLNPKLIRFLEMCQEVNIRRLTISTNGIKLRDKAYVRELARLEARIVLSLDTFDPAVDKKLLGANTIQYKLDVLDLLEKYDVSVTILPAVAAGLNDRDVPDLFDLVLKRRNILSLELHTLTFTGQGGIGFDRDARITTSDLHRILEDHTGGKITWKDFVPSPLAHPHCYSICYLLCLNNGGYVPFTRLWSREKLHDLLKDSLYIEPREEFEQSLRDLLNELWSDSDRLPESEAILSTIKKLLNDMFPPGRIISLLERQKIAERSAKAIYIHSHMDEENFDVAKIMKCSVSVPYPDGSNIPTCSYNVLYREKDPRFATKTTLVMMESLRQTNET